MALGLFSSLLIGLILKQVGMLVKLDLLIQFGDMAQKLMAPAIGISLGLNGLAAGAAIVGGESHMVGFSIASYRENGFGGLISQGLGTSMLQIGNIVKKPIIMLPAIISSIILGPISTVIFKMQATPAGSGMGTSGLVGEFSTYSVMVKNAFLGVLLLHFILPGLISYFVSSFMYKKGYIKMEDMKLSNDK